MLPNVASGFGVCDNGSEDVIHLRSLRDTKNKKSTQIVVAGFVCVAIACSAAVASRPANTGDRTRQLGAKKKTPKRVTFYIATCVVIAIAEMDL